MSKRKLTGILRRDGTVSRYDLARVTEAVFKATAASGNPNKKLAQRVAKKVETVLLGTYGEETTPSVEDIQDIVENVLMESGATKIARSYIIYRHHRAQLRAARAQPFEMSDIIPYRKIYEVLLWNITHQCDSVCSLNETISNGKFPTLVRSAEKRYIDEITQAAEMMIERREKLRLVIIAGPSSSGKTTSMIRLGERLKKEGLKLKAINVDHYFFDIEKHPRDEFGDYDYEAPQAIDLELINRHVRQLLKGKTVMTPHYDFKSGKRHLNVHEFHLERNEILLIDSLHGLYKDMTRSVPDVAKFRLYVETLGQLRADDGSFMRWADNRLLRRMLRDSRHRNSPPLQTLTHWHYVRTSELSHIIPYINTVDCVVNTAMPYELPLLKHRLYRNFPAAVRKFKDDPARQDAYIRAKRITDFLKPLKAISDDACVPKNSLLREFIGGSRYRY